MWPYGVPCRLSGATRLLLVRIVIAACVLAVVFGLTGVAIRIRYGTAPKLSAVVDVLILALVILSTWLYGRRIHHDRSRLECLRRTPGRNA